MERTLGEAAEPWGLDRAALEGKAYEDLAALVLVAEQAHFGARPVGRSEYEQSVGHLLRFQEACPISSR